MPIPGTHDAINALKERYKIAVLSNNLHRDIVKILKIAGFKLGQFDIIVGADDVEHQKPMPDEIFKAEKLAHEQASFMVGDTVYDIRAGKKANVKTVAVLTGVHPLSQLWAEKPTMVVKSVKDLPDILLEYRAG
jgi:phosphoglycolate phosphatase-like HAD superfamily hydrolase